MQYFKVIILLLPLLYNIAVGAPIKRLSIAIPTADGYPYIKDTVDRSTKHPGTYVEFLRILERKMNISIEIVRLPWKRCLSELKRGRVHGVISASYKKVREKIGVYPKKNGMIDPSRRFESGDYFLFVRQDSDVNWDGKKFYNLDGVVNAQLGFSIVNFLWQHNIAVNQVPSAHKAFELLSSGHGQAVAVHNIIGRVLLNQYSNIKMITPPLVSKPYYLLMSHQIYMANEQFVETLWDNVGEIYKSDELKEINKTYLQMKPW